MSSLEYLPQLIYYAQFYRKEFPKTLEVLIPQGAVLNSIARIGVDNTALETGVPRDLLWNSVNDGKPYGESSLKDYCELIYQIVINEINRTSGTITPEQQGNYVIQAMEFRNSWKTASFLTRKIVSLAELSDEGMQPFLTGCNWLDIAFGSEEHEGVFPYSVFTLGGMSGHGKTTLGLAIAHWMKLTGAVDEVWFQTTEVGEAHIKHKMRHVPDLQWDKKSDLLLISIPVAEINQMAVTNPNPNRLIITDGADSDPYVMADGYEALAFANYYMFLKEAASHSKFVITTSQLTQAAESAILNGGEPNSTSFANSVQKFRASDMVAVAHKQLGSNSRNGWSKLQFYSLKHRHANIINTRWTIPFNYRTFEFKKPDEVTRMPDEN